MVLQLFLLFASMMGIAVVVFFIGHLGPVVISLVKFFWLMNRTVKEFEEQYINDAIAQPEEEESGAPAHAPI